MSETYFSKFPTIVYSNTTCKDISRRVGLSNKTRNIPTLFYPYELQSGLRADLLAHTYYEDSYYDWLIYLTNNIIDPYYGWYLTENEFEAFIKKKYGSIEAAISRIKYYQLGWADYDIQLTPSQYKNNLPEVLKKYYVPVYGVNTRVIAYKRREEEWIVNTNKVLRYTINLHSTNTFSNGEILKIKVANTVVGNCVCISSNTTYVFVQHIAGNTSANQVLYGNTSYANADILTRTVLSENLTDDEYVFWTPVTYYDLEVEKNEANKFIQLLDGNHALDTSEQMRKKLKE